MGEEGGGRPQAMKGGCAEAPWGPEVGENVGDLLVMGGCGETPLT